MTHTPTEQANIDVIRKLFEAEAASEWEAMAGVLEATVATDELPVPKGTRLKMAFAQFLTVRDGKISASTEYLSWLPPESGQ